MNTPDQVSRDEMTHLRARRTWTTAGSLIPLVLLLSNCGSSDSNVGGHAAEEQEALGGFAAGTYLIADSASFAIDGGYYHWDGPTDERLYALTPTNTYQQWQFAGSGSGFTICNVGTGAGACLSDGGSLLDVGVGVDTWTVAASGAGYTLQNQRTGRFITDASPAADNAAVPVSAKATVWSITSVGGGGGGGTITVDDSDSSVIYSRSETSGNWNLGPNSSDYGGSAHFNNACQNPPQSLTPVQGPMAVINFSGTGISLIGERGNNLGIGAYAIDGGPLTKVDAYNAAANVYQQTLLAVSGLAPGSHVLSYQVTCTKNGSSSNYYQVIDGYKITGTALPVTSAEAGPWNKVTLTGSWNSGANSTNLSGGQLWSGTAGNTISWTFTGSLIEIFGRPDVGDGLFDVYIDGTRVAANVDSHYETEDNDLLTAYMLWAGKVAPGKHTVKVVVDGKEDAYNEAENSGQKNLVQFDEFLAFP